MAPTRPEPQKVVRRALGLRVHPELRKALKIAAASEGVSMEDWLHVVLCRELDRLDLLHQTPDATGAA